MALIATIQVTLKPSVLDPQGKATNEALLHLGYSQVKAVRIGKRIELDLEGEDPVKAKQQVEEMCDKLLANTMIERYSVEISAK